MISFEQYQNTGGIKLRNIRKLYNDVCNTFGDTDIGEYQIVGLLPKLITAKFNFFFFEAPSSLNFSSIICVEALNIKIYINPCFLSFFNIHYCIVLL